MKRKIRLTESDLHKIVKEVVRKVRNRKDPFKLSNDDLDTEDTPFGSFKVKNWRLPEPSKFNNESKLSRIVKESVNKLLAELDWKTYASAARKRALQGADDKVIADLDTAANKGLEKYDIGSEQPFYRYKNAPKLKTTKHDAWGDKLARQELKMPEHEYYTDNYSAYDFGDGHAARFLRVEVRGKGDDVVEFAEVYHSSLHIVVYCITKMVRR